MDNHGSRLNNARKQLIAIAASIPSALGGENHGYAGIIVKVTKYHSMAGTAFTIPNHPGIYPAGLAAGASAGGTRAREEALHKEQVSQFQNLQRSGTSTKRHHFGCGGT